MAETRKLAAILAADVVGYSRLAGADEDRTLARLRALRIALVAVGGAASTSAVPCRTTYHDPTGSPRRGWTPASLTRAAAL
jgi:hypothetical protein